MNECRKRFWDTFEQMQEDFDRFFEHYAQSKRTAFVSYGTRWSPACNIYETADCLSILVEIAGMDCDALDLQIEEAQLVLRGTRCQPAQPAMGCYQQMEIAFGEFELRVPLSTSVDAEAVHACYQHGFLSILLPKIPTPKLLRITLSIAEN